MCLGVIRFVSLLLWDMKEMKYIQAIVLAAFLLLLLGFVACNEQLNRDAKSSEVIGEDSGEKINEESIENTIELAPNTNDELAPAEPKVSPKRTITISFAGDVTLGNNQKQDYGGTFIEKYDQKGPTWFFDGVREVFSSDDMTLVNFEGVLSRSENEIKKMWNLRGYPEYNEILTDASIEAVSMGNNHRMDYGEEGETDTVNAIEEVNVTYAYDENVGIYEANDGIRVGFVSVNEVYDHEKVEDFIKNGIEKLKEEQVNIIIACCHWGIERDYYPTDYQKYLARLCIDEGADAVIGCHPHVLQGIDNYHGKYIFYSLGNFCFGGNRNPSDYNTMIAQMTFNLVGEEVYTPATEVSVIPCTLSSVMDHNDFQPTIAKESRREQIISRLNDYSKPFNVNIDEDGIVSR